MKNNKLTNQEKLDEMYEVSLENNELLSGLLRREKIANFFRIMYWAVILGGLFGAYYYAQPYIQIIKDNAGIVKSSIDQINNLTKTLPEVNSIKNIINTINNIKSQ